MLSLFAIVCSWKVKKHVAPDDTSFEGSDEFWVYLVNGISVLLALISNFFLLLNFRKKVRYVISQVVSVSGWFLASMSLMALIISYHAYFYHNHMDDIYQISYGFYFAVATVCLHFINFVLLFLNELGFLLKKYKPVFNINGVQKSLIFQSSALAVWLIVGSAMATKLLHCPFGFGLYYCTISIVTIGEQQDVPQNATAEGLMAFWILIGLVFFGLIVSSVIDTIIEFSSSTLYWHRLALTKELRLKLKQPSILSNRDAYEFMRDVDSIAELTQKLYSLLTALCIFMVIFLCGSAGFSLFEGWPYRLGCYFCFCSLVTLGCGDVVPVTEGGQVLFCVWALASIPSMTTLVSDLSELVFSRMKRFNDIDMYDVFYNIANSSKHLRLVAKVFSAKEDTVDIKDLENMMQEINLTVSHNKEKDLSPRSTALSAQRSPGELAAEEGSIPGIPVNSSGSTNALALATPGGKLPPNVSVPEAVYATVPLPTHPVDTLFEFILTNNKLVSLDFVNSPQFVDRVTMSTHLGNYCREGAKVVSFNSGQVNDARENLMKAFKAIDGDFDEDSFARNYELAEGPDPSEPDVEKDIGPQDESRKSVLHLPDNTIRTMFRKKHDYILNNLCTLQILITELKKAMMMMAFNPRFRYSLEDWDHFLRLTQNSVYLLENDNGEFWTGDRSPLGFPNHEPQYFAMTYLRHLESKLHQFAWEYDKDKFQLTIDRRGSQVA
ncbi:DEKNAAC101544 [Brettanomyces naardenensis]|uniref:DEKNAAC101544 n=1 Tax=Brettanomyces naardenensis TaxID=13370 RepID=A0A448YIG8_BRENA|nr:DEKNAAC101544 [Brettanomyces naardenensis]